MRLFRKREPTKNQGESKAENTVLKMVTTLGEFYYAWDGKIVQK
mgnify:FL=1